MRIKVNPLWKYLGILLIGLLVSTMMNRGFSLRHFIENVIYTFVYWEGAWYITGYSRKKFERFDQTKKRMIFQGIAITIYVSIVNFLLCSAMSWYYEVPFSWDLCLRSLRLSLFITALITSIYEAQNFFELWKKANIDSERLKQETLLAQFEALKTQVNPHFLFNSLNTLSAIIPEDPKIAVDFVQKLSNFYRYLLQYREQSLVSVAAEISCIESYLYLQHMRFGDNLTWHIKIMEDDKSALIPPLSLQILAENAVKHNMISSQKPLCIEVQSDGAFIWMSNKIQPKRQQEASTHIGLANLSERLRLTLNSELIIEKSEHIFTVKIPLSQHENTPD